ncbi:Uncharacterized protein TCM_027661 [Theobroma cacao]|uniref:Retrotransposon gag domain-containing protein n=1 Tax=Theobroma cacao TaxID=3641 RepID=A0A061G9Z8_THECC|nr:Uncharacterized protein TCM_027661 [Theobroma cacao]
MRLIDRPPIRLQKKNLQASTNLQIMTKEEEAKYLLEYVVRLVQSLHSSIRRLAIQVNNFEIKLPIIQMIQTSIQFGRSPNDDLNAYIVNFLEICDTFKHNGVTNDVIRLRLFPFSLRDKIKSWLNSLIASFISTRDDLAQKFLAKLFPPTKTANMWNGITSFVQFNPESLYEAWERTTIDATTSGALMDKSIDEAYDLLKEIAFNNYQWPCEKLVLRKVASVHELDGINAFTAQVTVLSKKFDTMDVHAI